MRYHDGLYRTTSDTSVFAACKSAESLLNSMMISLGKCMHTLTWNKNLPTSYRSLKRSFYWRYNQAQSKSICCLESHHCLHEHVPLRMTCHRTPVTAMQAFRLSLVYKTPYSRPIAETIVVNRSENAGFENDDPPYRENDHSKTHRYLRFDDLSLCGLK